MVDGIAAGPGPAQSESHRKSARTLRAIPGAATLLRGLEYLHRTAAPEAILVNSEVDRNVAPLTADDEISITPHPIHEP